MDTAGEIKRLKANECWELLRTVVVGRLSVIVEDHPDIFPVNFVVDHGSVIFRTAPGTKLAAALEKSKAAFEVDGYDTETGEAWSVVLKGPLGQITRTEEVINSAALPLFPWQKGTKPFFVRLSPSDVTGIRFAVVEPAHWVTPFTGLPSASSE
ncbi:pyridoxamine 5'-phosphate oxidase family protein [Paenarthrobacter sp. DKR-5]|uniref:pyridoxamine 5'-phosphate oxidase family protein n=1 Tax=Paenarthrobacter sp. DKR-5 TaxID=2835535 RepID=UPI0027DE55E0|nr:pyridoxamine 5'-phosphate oxidase family protein [Paenarthrobacter sp. DKR-5]